MFYLAQWTIFNFIGTGKEKNKNRSSRPEVFCIKDVLTNFANFAKKHSKTPVPEPLF